MAGTLFGVPAVGTRIACPGTLVRVTETTRRVVIAEDEALIRLDLKEMLEEDGYEVVGEAGDGETAVRLTAEQLPDLASEPADGASAQDAAALDADAPEWLLAARAEATATIQLLLTGTARERELV